ncbi:amidohydrolase family protein, partial [Bacillus sp. JCM 19041]|uniref:amidohydrolase family protein n=1 Tax=Bacillus sp. JCM 19041 TaxID=1460637 RepID=UPI0006D13024
MNQAEPFYVLNTESGIYETKTIDIVNGQIKRLQSASDQKASYYVIPGLIDSHCHINPSYAPLFTAAGITSVRNTAGSFFTLKPLLEAAKQSASPRVYTTDRMIDGVPGLWGETSMGSLSTNSKEEAIEEVKRQVAIGASFIKVYGRLSRSVMEAVVRESNQQGLEVSADLLASTDVNALTAAKIGVRYLEHNSGMLQSLVPGWHCLLSEEEDQAMFTNWDGIAGVEELCADLKKHDVKLVPTMVLFNQGSGRDAWKPKWQFKGPALNGLIGQWDYVRPYVNKSKKERLFIYTSLLTNRYKEIGGSILAGTDTPAGVDTYPGLSLHRELQLLVKAGFTPFEAIQAATTIPAREFGMSAELKEGAVADFLVLRADPLTHIENSQSVEWVVKGGKWYKPEELVAE